MPRDHAYELMRNALKAVLPSVETFARMAKSAPAKAGMFAKGDFELGESSALTVPQQSVVVRDGFSYVFRLNTDGRVSQVKVQTGRRLGDRVEVSDGIKPDSVLVASGAGFLNDGDLVKVVPAERAQIGTLDPTPAGHGKMVRATLENHHLRLAYSLVNGTTMFMNDHIAATSSIAAGPATIPTAMLLAAK